MVGTNDSKCYVTRATMDTIILVISCDDNTSDEDLKVSNSESGVVLLFI